MSWSAHLSALFQEWRPEERAAHAAQAGFAYVESWWPCPDPITWAESVRQAGVQLACINADGGDLSAGERGFLNRPEEREHSVDAVAQAVELAASLGCRVVNVLVGTRFGEAPLRRQLHEARSVLLECVAGAEAVGVTLVVEHMNERDVPGALLPTPLEAARFVNSVGSPFVRLLYDAYHAAQAGLDPVSDVRQYGALIGHVQYADSPGRGEPGTGSIDLTRFAASVREAGYNGPVGLEFIPTESTALALTRVPRAAAGTGFDEPREMPAG
jgi:hydroxypyruvate isomerase